MSLSLQYDRRHCPLFVNISYERLIYKAVEVIWIFSADERTDVLQEVLAYLKIQNPRITKSEWFLSDKLEDHHHHLAELIKFGPKDTLPSVFDCE